MTGTQLLSSEYNPILASLIFWSTLIIYQVNTKLKLNIADLSTFKYFEKAKKWRIITYLAINCIILLHIPFINLWSIIFIAHLGILSTLYNVPEKSYTKSIFPLRSIPILKVFLIAFVWASIASILPELSKNSSGHPTTTHQIVLSFILHFLFILSITLPFDIRDYKSDYNKISTVPHVIGINNTKILAVSCLLAFTAIFMFMTGNMFILIVTLVTGILIINSSTDKKDYYFTFFLDGTIILYFIIVKLFLD